MEEHISGILEHLGETWEYKAFLLKYGKTLGVYQDILDSLVKLTLILHDAGKAAKQYQERCERGDCTRFLYHYAISARIAVQLVDKLEMPILRELFHVQSYKPPFTALYISIVVMPILLHHYAQITEESLARAIEATRRINEVELYEPCRLPYIRELSELQRSSRASRELELIVKNAIEVFSSGRIKLSSPLPLNNIEEIIGVTRKISPLTTLIEASTGILNICDGRVAHKNRKERYPHGSLNKNYHT
jgi:CRISPR/Cas system-associated endonuclease Cas3-HD